MLNFIIFVVNIYPQQQLKIIQRSHNVLTYILPVFNWFDLTVMPVTIEFYQAQTSSNFSFAEQTELPIFSINPANHPHPGKFISQLQLA